MNRALMEWYEPRRRAYPWRRRSDPYRVLVSEVMLQQTQAARVAPAFEAFVERFPDVTALSRGPLGDVLRSWGSLGYNRRAVALFGAARLVVDHHGGNIPSDPAALRSLPGVGPYTAAAVASIAFGAPVPAVDTNVARVVRRARLGSDDASSEDLVRAARSWIGRGDPGAWNQAVMDLGREVCRPRPRCELCPLRAGCRFRGTGAVPRPGRSKQPTFDGSFRQVRGGVVRSLRSARISTLGRLSEGLEEPLSRVAEAVRALAAEGVVTAGPAALAGSARGQVRLPS